jgi:hypothetical protein
MKRMIVMRKEEREWRDRWDLAVALRCEGHRSSRSQINVSNLCIFSQADAIFSLSFAALLQQKPFKEQHVLMIALDVG